MEQFWSRKPMAAFIYYKNQQLSLYCGDAARVLAGFPSESFDLILTDCAYAPPPRASPDQRSAGGEQTYAECFRVLRTGGISTALYPWHLEGPFLRLWQSAGFQILEPHLYLGDHLSVLSQRRHSSFFLLAKGQPRGPGERIGHLEQLTFPTGAEASRTELFKAFLQSLANRSAFILDPFCGIGTSLLAAQGYGLTAVGIEADEGTCRNARSRLQRDAQFHPVYIPISHPKEFYL